MSNCCRISSARPRRTLEAIAGLVTLLAVNLAAAAELPPLGHRMNPVDPPIVAPDFSLPDMDGKEHGLQGLRGRVVLLNFWATWCPPCRREMPSMQRLYDRYRDRGLVVVAVNQWESPDLVFQFTGNLAVDPTFPILFDRDSRTAESYAVKGLPTTFLLDREGRIRFQAIGGREFDHPDVGSLVEALLD